MVDPPPSPSEPASPDSSGIGFGALARKLKRRTTDLLALAIIAIGLLAVGAKISRWWKQSPQDVIPPQTISSKVAPWGDAGVSMEFGQLNHALFRQFISGDANAAREQLEEISIGQLSKVSLAPNPPSLSEKKLLKELGNVPVSRTLPTGESLYRIGEDLPLVIVTRLFPEPGKDQSLESHRVVCWARAFPQSENQWLVVLFHPIDGSAQPSPAESGIPLPPGSERIQSLSDASGQTWIAFRGAGSILKWQRHFDQVLNDQSWDSLRSWQSTGSGWTAAFRSKDQTQRAEIWFTIDAEGICEGMLLIEPLLPSPRDRK